MRKFLLLIVITQVSGQLLSQNLPKSINQAKWQQRVAYNINVILDDSLNQLKGFETIQYTNNSPNSLIEIYMHLWPNAYRSRNTAFAKQHLENGKSDFYFAPTEQRGWIDSLHFMVGGKPVKWQLTQNIDIALLILNQPINPGQTVEISTPFTVKIPGIFSRMGYDEGLYCITQWYPKPAVYDVNGWNPMPYLDQGEFYSEFGSFDVRITLPKNYVVAATGLVQEESEKLWWLNRIDNATLEHPSLNKTKTLRFLQDSVHDFAWFCSKDFKVAHSEVFLNNGKKVDTWLFSKTKNRDGKLTGIEHLDEAIKFYSEKVGNYPYALAQVVITPLKAGGGMEYPTITNCQRIDKTIIVHEVGHNWFYGILGSNERDYPWMDESINTYYEGRNKNESKKSKTGVSAAVTKKGFSISPDQFNQEDLLFGYSCRKNIDQAGNLTSIAYTDNNYGAIIYAKNPLAFGYLQAYLGDALFDAMMQGYFENWKFKHPLPNDFRQHAEQFTGKNLNWFFDDILGSTKKQDYKIVAAKEGFIRVKNKGELIAPLAITQILNDSTRTTRWVEGFKGSKSIDLYALDFPPASQSSNLIYRIDGEKSMLELYRQNNTSVVKGWCNTCANIKFQPLVNFEDEHSAQIFWLPVYAYNIYNNHMLGMAFYNSIFPQKKNEFIVMPVYSFTTKDVNGYAQYWHNFYTGGKIRNIQVGFKAARFASEGVLYNYPGINGIVYNSYTTGIAYLKLAPFISINIQPKVRRSGIEQNIQARYVMINEAVPGGFAYDFGNTNENYGIAELSYQYQRPMILYPAKFEIQFQKGIQNVSMNRLSADFTQSFLLKGGKKQASIRFFGGLFLGDNTNTTLRGNDVFDRSRFMIGGTLGRNDYLYDAAMFGRANNDYRKVLSHQILQRDAGFRNFVDLGNAEKWITAVNVSIPFPIPVPIGIYGDLSYAYSKTNPDPYTTAYVGGVYIKILKDIFYIYVPLVSSNNVETAWNNNDVDNIYKRSTFVLNLNKINPISLIRNLKL
ncbi:MAG: M1 family metallopeptidase [Bacteroidota bacterium]|nr:M1 family metallopeptidase [Bacteroidota bacterium]